MRLRPTRLRAVLALIAFVASLGVRAADTRHVFGADPDVDRGLAQAVSDRGPAALAPPDDGVPDEHCVVCHWARTFAGSIAGEPVAAVAPDAAPGDAAALVRHFSATDLIAAPPRGPPSTSL